MAQFKRVWDKPLSPVSSALIRRSPWNYFLTAQDHVNHLENIALGISIMMKMRAGKTRLWQGIFKGWNGKWYGFFPGTDDSATYQATEFAKDPAGTIKIHLIKQGWSRNCIKALIKKSCTESAAEAATHAVWCTKTQRVLSGDDIMHSKHNATIDVSFINRDFAYTPWERQNIDLLMLEPLIVK